MTVTLPATVTGLDGKTYPSVWLRAEDRQYLVGLVHQLHCDERLPVRVTLARIAEMHDIRRSVGWAAGVLKNHTCDRCSAETSDSSPTVPVRTPEHRDPAACEATQ